MPSLELRRREPYPGVGQDEPRMLRSLLGAARRSVLFSPSLFSYSSLHLSPRQPSFCPPLSFSILPLPLSHLFLSFLSSCTQCVPLISVLLCALPSIPSPPPSSSSRARTRRAFRKRLSHVYAGVCVVRTHMRGPLLRAVEGKEG